MKIMSTWGSAAGRNERGSWRRNVYLNRWNFSNLIDSRWSWPDGEVKTWIPLSCRSTSSPQSGFHLLELVKQLCETLDCNLQEEFLMNNQTPGYHDQWRAEQNRLTGQRRERLEMGPLKRRAQRRTGEEDGVRKLCGTLRTQELRELTESEEARGGGKGAGGEGRGEGADGSRCVLLVHSGQTEIHTPYRSFSSPGFTQL